MKKFNNSILYYIEKACLNNPEKIAIVTKKSLLTYAEIWDKACDISAYLQNLNISSGSVIALIQNDIENALPTIFGILHAGCIYTPISPDAPKNRVDYMLNVGKVAHIIHDVKAYDDFGINLSSTHIEDIPKYDNKISPKEFPIAYIMFTSGSTGDPKGVAITHLNLKSIYEAWESEYKLLEIDSHLQMANLTFDVFAGDWLRSLCSGATLYAIEDILNASPDEVIDFINKYKIQCAEFTPMRIRQIYKTVLERGEKLNSFKLLICGSDTMRVREFKTIQSLIDPSCRLIFSYGTTETTIDSSYFEPDKSELGKLNDDLILPIGKPFNGTDFKIFAQNGIEITDNSIGELYIGGMGVGAGYILHNSKTAGKYKRRLPLFSSSRWYKTGDLASYDGKYYWLHGRADSSIKIKEKFVDLPDIEAIIRTYEGIEDCAVAAIHNGIDLELKALVTPVDDSQICVKSLANHISMHSSVPIDNENIFNIKKLPMTFSGKIDRNEVKKLLNQLN